MKTKQKKPDKQRVCIDLNMKEEQNKHPMDDGAVLHDKLYSKIISTMSRRYFREKYSLRWQYNF